MRSDGSPLYVEARDLAAWVIARANTWPPERDRYVAPVVVTVASELVTDVALALTFPASRREHLEQADWMLVRLRELLRLARVLNLVSAGGLRFSTGRLQAIGRMIGGWKKSLRGKKGKKKPGDGPPAAVNA